MSPPGRPKGEFLSAQHEGNPVNPPRDDASWQDTQRKPSSREELLAPSTQVVADRDAYLGQGRHDVGRRISDDQVELFISSDVGSALQQEFTRHTPEFIAVHDIGTSASLRLLSSLAGAAGARVQKLSIRKQGHGVALAVLQFVEVPLADSEQVRLYSTEVSADTAVRGQVTRALLAFSRLGVLLVGELPAAALTAQLNPLHEAQLRGPWPNRELLMVPLGSGIKLAAPAAQLAGQGAVAVHVTPHADKPRHAWTFIAGAWNRLHGAAAGQRALPTELARAVARPQVPRTEATTEPMPLDPVPAPAAPAPLVSFAPSPVESLRASLGSSTPMRSPAAAAVTSTRPAEAATANRWQAYVDRCMVIKGAVACCVFDMQNLRPLAHAGGPPAGDVLAQQGAAMLGGMEVAALSLGLGHARAEAMVSVSGHHLLLRPVGGHRGIVMHLVIRATAGNLTLARMQLERIEAPAAA